MTMLMGLFAVLGVTTDSAVERHPAVDVFVSACIDGALTGTPDDFREVHDVDLPPVIRRLYRGADGWRYVEITRPSRAYVMMRSGDQADEYETICAVGAPQLDARDAHDQVWRVIWGTEPTRLPRRGPLYYEFSNFAEGYRFRARDLVSGWAVLQIRHVGEGGRQQFEAEAQRVQRQFERQRRTRRQQGTDPQQ